MTLNRCEFRKFTIDSAAHSEPVEVGRQRNSIQADDTFRKLCLHVT